MHNRRLFRSKSFAKRLKNGLAKKKALHYSYTDDTAKYIVSRWNRDLLHARNCPFFTWVKGIENNTVTRFLQWSGFFNKCSNVYFKTIRVMVLNLQKNESTSGYYFCLWYLLTIYFLIGLTEVKRRQWPLNGMGSSTSPCTRFWWNPIYSPRQSSNACSPFRARASPPKRTPCIWKDKVKKPHSSSIS